MSTILVPLDGSALAEQVLPYVRLLSPLLHSRVCLLRVVSDAEIEQMLAYEVVRLEAGADQVMPHALREQRVRMLLCTRAQDYLDAHAAQLRATDLTVQSAVRVGLPEDCILQMAEQTSSRLIAMATHGYGGLRRWALGSVTDKIVQAAEAPVLIVRGAASHAPPRLRRIMVPLDGSDLARQALPLAVELVEGAQAELILFQSITPTVETYPYPPLPAGIQTMLRDQAHQALAVIAAQLGQQPVVVTPVVTLGDAAETIVDQAAQGHMDLIVMATHGYSGLRRWAPGSVADKVLHATTIPLLLVRARPR